MSKGLIENLACVCAKTVFKANSSTITEMALREGASKGILLLEEFNNEDANQLAKATDELKKLIGQLETRFADAGEGWAPVIADLKGGVDSLDTKEIAQLALSGETKKLAKAAAEYTKRVQSVASETAAILDATEQMRKNLANFDAKVPDDKKSSTIASLSDTVENFPDLAKLDKGISSVYKVPKWFESAWTSGADAAKSDTEGGFFKKAMSFVGGLFKGAKSGRLVDSKKLADAIKSTPFGALQDLDLSAEVASLTNSSKAAGEETTELASAGVESQGETAASTNAGKGEDVGEPIASEQEASEEVDLAASELAAAAEEAVADLTSPRAAVDAALDDWTAGLSPSSNKTITASDRIGKLKSGIHGSLERVAQVVEDEVKTAIKTWRDEHEETLIKSKRFAKKNFDSLEDLVPQIAAQMLKKTAENQSRLTKSMVHKSVHTYLNKKLSLNGVLLEAKRWELIAGVRRK